MEFKNIIGNTEVKDYLSKSIKQNNILHSYLFLGKEGIGKLLIAKEFAKAILCLNEDKNDECTCKSCTCFNGKNHPDFYVINEEGETIKIEAIRSITEKVYEKPYILYVGNVKLNMGFNRPVLGYAQVTISNAESAYKTALAYCRRTSQPPTFLKSFVNYLFH